MRKGLYNLLVCLNNSINRMSVTYHYYPPKLNLDRNQDVDSLIKELNKVSQFLKAPEYSYLCKYNKVKSN